MIVSAPLPAAQPPTAASVFAAVIASAKLQSASTVIVAALTGIGSNPSAKTTNAISNQDFTLADKISENTASSTFYNNNFDTNDCILTNTL